MPKWLWRAQSFLSVTEIVNHMLKFLRVHYTLYPHIFCSIRDIHPKFTDRTCFSFCNNMKLTIFISQPYENATMRQRIGTSMGVSVHLPCLVVNLDGNRIKICCKLSPLYLILQMYQV